MTSPFRLPLKTILLVPMTLLTKRPCNYQVEALTDCVIYRMRFDDLQEVYSETSVGNEIGQKVNESLYCIKSKRELSLLTQSAQER